MAHSRYSPYWDDALGFSHGELLALVRRRVERLERELRLWRQLLELLEGGDGWRPGEKPEEVKVGRTRVAVIYRGEDYVRMVPSVRVPDARDVRSYLEEILSEIREMQARGDAPTLARLEVRRGPDGSIAEILYSDLHSAVELLKAKAALKHVAHLAWEIIKAQKRNGGAEP